MPREGLCRILLVLCIAEKGTNQEVAYQRPACSGVVSACRRANGEIAGCHKALNMYMQTPTQLTVGTSNDSRGQSAPSIADRANDHRAGNFLSSVLYQ